MLLNLLYSTGSPPTKIYPIPSASRARLRNGGLGFQQNLSVLTPLCWGGLRALTAARGAAGKVPR